MARALVFLSAIVLVVTACGQAAQDAAPGPAMTRASPQAAAPAPLPPPAPVELSPAGSTSPAPPSELEPTRAPRRFQLLNGRLSATLPAGGHVAEGDGNPLPEPGEIGDKSRHAVDDGTFHVAIASFELFAPVGADFEAEIRAGLARWKRPPRRPSLEALSAHAPLRVVLVTLPEPDRAGLSDETGSLSLVSLLYVAHPDGTVQAIELHTNDANLGNVARVTALARQIGESLEVGPLGMPHAAGTRVVPIGTRELQAEVPEGFVGAAEIGMDYTIASLMPLSPIASGGPRIDVGSFASDDPDWPPPAGTVSSRLFDQPVRYRRGVSRGRRELSAGVEVDDWRISVTLSARTQAELDALLPIAETMRLVQPPAPPE